MRPDDRRANMGWSADDGGDGFDAPLDADLASLDAELAGAGAQARRALGGRTQPTRVFSRDLRERLLGAAAEPAAPAYGTDVALPRGSVRGSRLRPEMAGSGEAWAPARLQPRLARRAPTTQPRGRWALLAAAALTTVLVAGALGARLDWLFPMPTSEASGPPSTATSAPSPASSADALARSKSAAPTTAATEAPGATSSPKPAPTRKPAATGKPDPTAPPVVPMALDAKACPGGVVLDWTKPSTQVTHYHVLRSLSGEVPATYPADGATEVESATSWSKGITDGFDAGLGDGISATYRAFAFDAADQLLAVSPSRTVATIGRVSLGALGVEVIGPGSLTASWSGSEVPEACFSYGKLVASAEDPDPSYLKGSPYLTAIGDLAATSVTLEGLPSGETVWMRYELIRVTGTGKFVVARTDVLQVTYP